VAIVPEAGTDAVVLCRWGGAICGRPVGSAELLSGPALECVGDEGSVLVSREDGDGLISGDGLPR